MLFLSQVFFIFISVKHYKRTKATAVTSHANK